MIAQDDNGKFIFKCKFDPCEFVSSGWPDEAGATERGQQHESEHKTGNLMESLEDFEVRLYGERVQQ